MVSLYLSRSEILKVSVANYFFKGAFLNINIYNSRFPQKFKLEIDFYASEKALHCERQLPLFT